MVRTLDTSDMSLLDSLEKKKEKLNSKLLEKGFYDNNDFALVRTTNYLGNDKIIKAICQMPFVCNIHNISFNVMNSLLMEKYNINVYDESDQYENLKKEACKYSPLSTQYRSTIHFTLNGLVSNHSKGNFDKKNFIIIDKLKYHLGKEDFRSIRMEDTFAFGEFLLSEESIILIDEIKYPKLIEKYPHLNDYNIILFNGDENVAVQVALTELEIMPEKIETHSAEFSERTELYNAFFASVTEKYGVEEIKHFYSPEYEKDDQKSLLLWKIYDRNFYNELFTYFNVSAEEKENLLNILLTDEADYLEQESTLKNFILKMGLNEYQQFVVNYNESILNAIKNGTYPSNDEILLEGCINIKSQKNKAL